MYPDRMPLNAWYVLARSSEIGSDMLIRRWLHGTPIVLYRTEAGVVRALIDQCVHRQMPLSLGCREGDGIRCGYHGLLYDGTGQCIEVPGRTNAPAALRIVAFPVVEHAPFVWVWGGRIDKADPALIPSYPWVDEPGWEYVEGTKQALGRTQLLNENLLDLSHVEFLHPASIGVSGIAASPITNEFGEDWVTVARYQSDTPATPFHQDVMGVHGRVDRIQIAEWRAPAFHMTHFTARQNGHDFTHHVLHALAPMSRTSTLYSWAVVRNYNLGRSDIDEVSVRGVNGVFSQDVAAVEAIETVLQAYEPVYPFEHNIGVDGGPLRSRRIIEQMIALEDKDSETMQMVSAQTVTKDVTRRLEGNT